MSDVDLDDLLDDALDQMDVQDKQREEEQKAKEEAAQKLLEEDANDLTGQDKELLDVITRLMGGAGGVPGAPGMPGGPGGEQDLSGIHNSLSKVIEDLKKECTSEEDHAQLAQCTELLGKLGEADHTPHEPTPEEVQKMNEAMQKILESAQGMEGGAGGAPPAEGGAAANPFASMFPTPNPNATPEELEAQVKQMMEVLQAQQNTDTEMDAQVKQIIAEAKEKPEGLDGLPFVKPGSTPEEAEAQVKEFLLQMKNVQAEMASKHQDPTALGEGGAAAAAAGQDPLQGMLKHLLNPSLLGGPFRASKKAYPVWFERHGGAASAADVERYKQQVIKVDELLHLMDTAELDKAVENEATEEQRKGLDRFVALVEELQQLGTPPPELNDIVKELEGVPSN